MNTHKPHAYAAARATLGYGLPLTGPPESIVHTVVIQEGWVLKKRRKKMQGFARRYFVLYQTGLLTYSFEPGQPVRDQIILQTAAITTSPGRKDIHIDSSKATFHIKCLSTEDFSRWMAAFRKFSAPGPEARMSSGARRSRHESLMLSKSVVVIEEMTTTLNELEDAFSEFVESTSKKHLSVGRSKSEKDKHRESGSVFGIFKKAHHHDDAQRADLVDHPTSEQRVKKALQSLKTQHMSLLKSLHGMSPLDTSTTLSGHPSPLPITAEEEEQHGQKDNESGKFSVPFTRNSKRNSIATTMTESIHEWFDASEGHEGAEHFVLDVTSPDASEQPNRITSDSQSDLGRVDDSASLDTDIESLNEEPQNDSPAKTHMSSQDVATVVRRTALPAPVVGDEGSLFTVLKKNVGKDLSTIALPVTFNEPLTLLQRTAEELEYYDLLDQAAKESDPVKRLQYVAAFAVSSYAHTRHRTGRKGFNPMLGETFEDVRMKFIAEKVRHNPVEMAYHAEGADWELTATSAGKTKFWGKSLEIIPLGTTHLRIGKDHYQWKKPSSFMRNLMVGTKYLEHVGNMVIHNNTDDTRCVLEFKPSGYWGASNVVSGTVQNSAGKPVSKLEGKWDEHFSHEEDSSHFVVLWRATPWPKNAHDYYGFTSFSITLNEITADIAGKLPPTDSRLRTDVRALEEGNLDTAEAEKVRIEEAQRERRRLGNDQKPRWFKQQGEEWIYAGGYWEARANGWKGVDTKPLW
ncbi:Oxysterol-binding protein 3 [Marasmius crinis-equi]|uniref:Oxysterol-binding protein 3 n=1 Tax=Marasmius crinis-equi TaxID=585013 RepID=A0ABR3FID7_9AGAR